MCITYNVTSSLQASFEVSVEVTDCNVVAELQK